MFSVGDRVICKYDNHCYGYHRKNTLGTVGKIQSASCSWISIIFDNEELQRQQDYEGGWHAGSFELVEEPNPSIDVWE